MVFYVGRGERIKESDFPRLADKYGIEEALIRTVFQVESNGKGVTSGGAVTALYEPHIAYRYSTGTQRSNLVKHGLAYEKWRSGSYPKTSYPRIDKACMVASEELAALSTSWGLGQIMGFNHKAAGYPSAVAMVKAFAESEANQLDGMMNFIKSNGKMYAALKSKDWPTFARLYNGKGYKANKYDVKLTTAYNKWKGIVSARPVTKLPPAPPPRKVETVPITKPAPTKPVTPVVPWWKALIDFIVSIFRRKK